MYRIVIFTDRYFYPSIGGSETFAHLIASHLSKSKWDVYVFTLSPNSGDELKVPYKIVRRRGWVDLLRLLWSADILLMNGIATKLLPFLFLRLFKLVIVHQGSYLSDNLQVNNGMNGKRALDVIKEFCIRIINCVLRPIYSLLKFKSILRQYVCRILVYKADLNVYISNWVRTKYPANLQHKVIYDGVDTNFFVPSVNVSKHNIVTVVGRMILAKGFTTLIKAVALLKTKNISFSLCLIGDGPDRHIFEEMSEKMNLTQQINFFGFATGVDLLEYYQKSSIVVVPSIAEEPFGIVAIEAMSCAKPVVASDCGGLPEAVGDAGILVPPNNSQALADTLEHLLLNPAICSDLGKRARERVKKLFDMSVVGLQYEAALFEILKRKK